MVAFAQKRYSIEEYLELEYSSEIRHEYIAGKIVPMPHTSKNHGRIASNLNAFFHLCLKGTGLEVYAENRMLHIPECERFYYPDLAIIPIEVETFSHKKKMEADLFPQVVIEILSSSTEEYDREDKWRCYQQIKTLQQYVLVSQNEIFVQVFSRQDNDSPVWIYTSYQDEMQKAPIASCEVPLKEIYDRVEFEKPEAPSSPE
ncbi:MAG: Uma2 family endonuclease [Saprospiraceae bacterium]